MQSADRPAALVHVALRLDEPDVVAVQMLILQIVGVELLFILETAAVLRARARRRTRTRRCAAFVRIVLGITEAGDDTDRSVVMARAILNKKTAGGGLPLLRAAINRFFNRLIVRVGAFVASPSGLGALPRPRPLPLESLFEDLFLFLFDHNFLDDVDRDDR